MKSLVNLKFEPQLAELILAGKKTSTWRLFNDKNLRVGDIVDLIARPNLNIFAKAKLLSVENKKLGQLDDSDWIGHGRFASEEEMYKTYEGYYNKPVDGKTIVTIIKFEVLHKF